MTAVGQGYWDGRERDGPIQQVVKRSRPSGGERERSADARALSG
jgi:hypothetical protein